ncbi:MAG: hypothetical protein JO097_11110 [Acidobacteriaceae bacterium]|nr:hypothetical protein [Acidobacteriaceae bacterium]MBV9294903.1 hypothetical protein [Acidobacteriaceae bacterium]
MEVLTQEVPAVQQDLRLHWRMLTVLSLVLVLVPEVFLFVKLPPVTTLYENRRLAAKPAAPKTFKQWESYPSELNDYIQDNFPLRARLISWTNTTRYLMGYSGSKLILVGRHGWLFYDDGTQLKFWRGQHLTDAELGAWMERFRSGLDSVNRRGIRLYLLFPPYKETIYPEELPFWMRLQRKTELDQVIERLRTAGLEDHLIDVRSPLLTRKDTGLLYYPFDSHWNRRGAYIAYRQVIGRMQKDFPDMQPLPSESFPLRYRRQEGDLAYMLGVGQFVGSSYERTDPVDIDANTTWLTPRHDWTAPHILRTGAHNGRTLLLSRDSFSGALVPFLAPHFERIILTYIGEGFFRKDLIEQFHPDIVLVESIENYCSVF